MFLILAPPNLAPGVLITLFHIILAETISAVCVVSSNEVAPNCDPYSFWVVFLGAVVDNNSCIRDRLVFRDASDFVVREIENRVCANRYTLFALCKAVQLL